MDYFFHADTTKYRRRFFAHWYAKRFLEHTLYCIDDAHMNYPA